MKFDGDRCDQSTGFDLFCGTIGLMEVMWHMLASVVAALLLSVQVFSSPASDARDQTLIGVLAWWNGLCP